MREKSPFYDAVCDESEIVALHAQDPAPGKGTWSIGTGGGSFTDAHAYENSVTNLSKTTTSKNQIKWTVTYTTKRGHECVATSVREIENDKVEAVAEADKEVCEELP